MQCVPVARVWRQFIDNRCLGQQGEPSKPAYRVVARLRPFLINVLWQRCYEHGLVRGALADFLGLPWHWQPMWDWLRGMIPDISHARGLAGPGSVATAGDMHARGVYGRAHALRIWLGSIAETTKALTGKVKGRHR